MKKMFTVSVMFLLFASGVQAQTNLKVLGTGQLAWDQYCGNPAMPQPCALSDAQSFTYRVYMPVTTTTPITLSVTCVAPVPPATAPQCKAPLNVFPLTSTPQGFTYSAAANAADGSQTEVKTTSPFALSKTALAAGGQNTAVTP